MADQKHVEILKQGVDAWNTWREENPDVIPDLSGAELNEIELPGANLKNAIFYKVELGEQLVQTQMRKANLKGADLSEANLKWVNLSNTKLDNAILHEANLSNANLESCGFTGARMTNANLEEAKIRANYFFSADLTGANLQKAEIHLANFGRANMSEVNLQETDVIQTQLTNTKLTGANLRGTNFASSNLSQADLRWACVEDANFSQVSMGGTILAEMDLSGVKGLDEIFIKCPLVIDFSTIYKSNGRISQNFLRRAGVPEEMITLFGASDRKFSLSRIYIAFTNENHEAMKKLMDDLIDSKVACWPYNLDANSHWLHLMAGLTEYKKRIWDRLIVICSRKSFGHEYLIDALNKEYELEIEAGRDDLLIPICLDEETLAIWHDHNEKNEHKKKVVDFRQWQEPDAYQKTFQELLNDLRRTNLEKD